MLQIAICDDEKNTVAGLEKQLKCYADKRKMDINIKYFITPVLLYDYIKKENVDIIFMDLEFGSEDNDGILWSKKIHKEFPQTILMILTAYEKRYKEGYEAKAFRFMTKDFDYYELSSNMDACIEELNLYKTIVISSMGNMFKIPINEILYFSAQSGGSVVKTQESEYYCDENLKQWEMKVSQNMFFRCHKKYLVNLNSVIRIKNHTVVLINNDELPVSRRKWTLLKEAYIKFDIVMKGKK